MDIRLSKNMHKALSGHVTGIKLISLLGHVTENEKCLMIIKRKEKLIETLDIWLSKKNVLSFVRACHRK